MKLTEQQVNFFNTFGYLAFPSLFSPDEVAWITEEFDFSIQNFGKVRRTMAQSALCSADLSNIVQGFAHY